MENKVTDETLKSYLSQIEYLKFKEEIGKDINQREAKMRDDLYKVQLSNAQVLPLLESIGKTIDGMEKKMDEVNESQKDMSKALGNNTVDIAVLKEVHNSSKPAVVKQDDNGKLHGLNNILEYKKSIIVTIITVLGTVGVALLNNAEKILSFFGI